jgi:hypothetical protein
LASAVHCSWQISLALRPPQGGEAVVISDDGNYTYISRLGLTAQWFDDRP